MLIYSAIGSFDKVDGVIGESGQLSGAGPLVDDAFSLQVNTQKFDTPLCNGRAGCQGWQQFI
jgi:hypothetical protein